MRNSIKTPRTYYIGAAILAALTALLRALSLTLTFDPANGYYTPGALPIITRVFTVLSLIALLLFPIFALKDRIKEKHAAPTTHTAIGAWLCALLLLLNFICGCTLQSAALPVPILAVGLLALLVAIAYFVLQTRLFKASATVHVVLGCFTIVALACLIAFTYFDISTPMNVPHKVELHLALLAAMLYFLYELRAKAEISRPLALCVCGGIAFFLAVSVGLSDTTAYLAGSYTDPVYLAQDLLLLSLAVYIGARGMADAALFQKLTERTDSNECQ